MLSFLNEPWHVRHGPSRFEAWITPKNRTPEDVLWSLELHYTAAGARWRRVQEHQRPEVELSLTSWDVPGGKWTGIEDIKHWGGKAEIEKKTGMPWIVSWEGGYLDVMHRTAPGAQHELTSGMCADWQVRERDGARFLVELAVGAGEPPLVEEKVLVLEDGEEEAAAERDPADFWKQNAAIYAVEWVPFGQVTVQVPRNARDYVAYARRRAHELLGISTPPEAYQMHDYLESRANREEAVENRLNDDVFVKLHFHGYYEDE